MATPSPRLAGRPLRLLGSLLRSGTLGPPLRRAMSAMVVDANLATIDFAAAGEPAPYYQPPPFSRAPVPAASGSDGPQRRR